MTTGGPHSVQHHQALELAKAGHHEQALARLREHLLAEPRDGQALNDAGAILYALGRHDQAARHLRAALEQLGGYPRQPTWNLAEVYLADGKAADLLALLDQLLGAGALTPELANHAAMRLVQQGHLAAAIEAMLRSFGVQPRQDELVSLYDRVRSMRPKVAFVPDAGGLRPAGCVHEFLRARFQTRLPDDDAPESLGRLLDWCDIAWLDGCGPKAFAASRLPKRCRIVCRLLGHEAFLPWPRKVDWQRVDVLISPGPGSVPEYVREQMPALKRQPRIVTIPCGVDTAAMEFLDRPRGKHLACLAHPPCAESFALVLQCFQKLHSIDAGHRLFLAGLDPHDDVLGRYLRAMVDELGLSGAVVLEPAPANASDWFQDKQYVVSCGVHEGCPVSVLEGMACGLKPVVHTWPGCRGFFLESHLFRTVDEFCHRVLEASWQPQAYHDFVARRYPLAGQLAGIDDCMRKLEARLAADRRLQACASAGGRRDRGGASGPRASAALPAASGQTGQETPGDDG